MNICGNRLRRQYHLLLASLFHGTIFQSPFQFIAFFYSTNSGTKREIWRYRSRKGEQIVCQLHTLHRRTGTLRENGRAKKHLSGEIINCKIFFNFKWKRVVLRGTYKVDSGSVYWNKIPHWEIKKWEINESIQITPHQSPPQMSLSQFISSFFAFTCTPLASAKPLHSG